MTEQRIDAINRYFRTVNYLGAAQIYLRENALLDTPLKPEHIKPRLLGHWGTQPGLNLVYAHLNRLIVDTDAQILLVVGPGHGAPAILANLFLEGSLQAFYPDITPNRKGIERLVHRFSWPDGFPSHLVPSTPGAIHDGGELGYALLHAYGAALDNPDLIVACVIGDGEAETGALSASWHVNKFVDPRTSGAVLPILHVNGYKLGGPTLLGRMSDRAVKCLLEGYGYHPFIVSGDRPKKVHRALWRVMDEAYAEIRLIQEKARGRPWEGFPEWPVIVLRTPKGWTGPKELDGVPVEGTFHAHQVPIPDPKTNPGHLKLLEEWLSSYAPRELFDRNGSPRKEILGFVPAGSRRMGMNPHALGGDRLIPLERPDFRKYAAPMAKRGEVSVEPTRSVGRYLRDLFVQNKNARNFRFFCPDETASNKLDAIYEATDRAFLLPTVPTDEHLSRNGRVVEVLSEHICEGLLEGYLLTGRHGLFACYEAFISVIDSMANQFAKWIEFSRDVPWRTPVASMNYLLTSHVWRQDHNGFSHQGPGFINLLLTKKNSVVRVYLPPDVNCLLSVVDHCVASKGYLNLVVANKNETPVWLSVDEAVAHCRTGVSVWEWAGNNNDDGMPDVVLAAAGDVPTVEVMAAADLLKKDVPALKFRVVNVVDLFTLDSFPDHPHRMSDDLFEKTFTVSSPVIFAFHGYPRTVHELIYRRSEPERFHVKGYKERGTTTTAFDMLVKNGMSRFDLAISALRSVTRLEGLSKVVDRYEEQLVAHRSYIREHGHDMPEITGWKWGK